MFKNLTLAFGTSLFIVGVITQLTPLTKDNFYATTGSVSTLTWDDCEDDDSKDIPEPTAIAGILLVGGLAIFLKPNN